MDSVLKFLKIIHEAEGEISKLREKLLKYQKIKKQALEMINNRPAAENSGLQEEKLGETVLKFYRECEDEIQDLEEEIRTLERSKELAEKRLVRFSNIEQTAKEATSLFNLESSKVNKAKTKEES